MKYKKLYDVRFETRIILPGVDLETALMYVQNVEPEIKHLYTITTAE